MLTNTNVMLDSKPPVNPGKADENKGTSPKEASKPTTKAGSQNQRVTSKKPKAASPKTTKPNGVQTKPSTTRKL